MKKKLFLLLVVVLCFGLTGCTSDSVDKTEEDTQVVEAITQEEKEVVVTDFLCEIFTFNCNGRYDTFMQTVEGIDYLANAEISEDAIAELPDEFQVAYILTLQDYQNMLRKIVLLRCRQIVFHFSLISL